MATKITVYATKQSALNIKHPVDGALALGGSLWTNDGFTARMLRDELVTQDQTKAYMGPAPAPRVTPRPAPGTFAFHKVAPKVAAASSSPAAAAATAASPAEAAPAATAPAADAAASALASAAPAAPAPASPAASTGGVPVGEAALKKS